jgi:hypothetical protein
VLFPPRVESTRPPRHGKFLQEPRGSSIVAHPQTKRPRRDAVPCPALSASARMARACINGQRLTVVTNREVAEVHLNRQRMSGEVMAQDPQLPEVGRQPGSLSLNNDDGGVASYLSDDAREQGHDIAPFKERFLVASHSGTGLTYKLRKCLLSLTPKKRNMERNRGLPGCCPGYKALRVANFGTIGEVSAASS